MESAELGFGGEADWQLQRVGGQWREANVGIQTFGFLALLRAIDSFDKFHFQRENARNILSDSQHDSLCAVDILNKLHRLVV